MEDGIWGLKRNAAKGHSEWEAVESYDFSRPEGTQHILVLKSTSEDVKTTTHYPQVGKKETINKLSGSSAP